MAQAKTFKTEELGLVLNFVKNTKHALRNRAILLLTHWAGLRWVKLQHYVCATL